MNISSQPLAPLPMALQQARAADACRRHHIGDYEVPGEALAHFNELLTRLNFSYPCLQSDQLASAARELVNQTCAGNTPRCIRQRLRRAAAIDLMRRDPDWGLQDGEVDRIVAGVIDYVRGNTRLIPRAAPVVARLDDAIVIEAAWPCLATEVQQYLAFCQLRRVEALLRGETRQHFGFTREQWQLAALAQAAWIEHCLRVGGSSYLRRDAGAGFRVH